MHWSISNGEIERPIKVSWSCLPSQSSEKSLKIRFRLPDTVFNIDVKLLLLLVPPALSLLLDGGGSGGVAHG